MTLLGNPKIPLAHRSKVPLVKRWQELPANHSAWAQSAQPGCNWGLRLDGLTVIDCDCPEAVAWWEEHGPATPVQSCGRRERRHYWYRGEVRRGKWRLPDGRMAGDIKSGAGSFMVIPPSVHPDTGESYRWVGEPLYDNGVDRLPGAPVLQLVELRATTWDEDAGLAHGWDRLPEGTRDNALTGVAGYLRRHGASDLAMANALRVLNRVLCDPPLPVSDLLRIARSVARYESEPALGGGLVMDDEMGAPGLVLGDP